MMFSIAFMKSVPGVINELPGLLILLFLCVCILAKGAGPSKARTKLFVGVAALNCSSKLMKIRAIRCEGDDVVRKHECRTWFMSNG